VKAAPNSKDRSVNFVDRQREPAGDPPPKIGLRPPAQRSAWDQESKKHPEGCFLTTLFP
jgi:hypothetical protein